MTHFYWWCLHCDAEGEYEHTAKGEMGGRGTAARHTNDQGHTTVSSINPRTPR